LETPTPGAITNPSWKKERCTVSVRKTRSAGPILVTGGSDEDVPVFVSASVDELVPMVLYQRSPDDSLVAIMFGKERITLEFYDVESLERLRDLADEGVRRLRAAFDTTGAEATELAGVAR
jgi:hypothetical protein